MLYGTQVTVAELLQDLKDALRMCLLGDSQGRDSASERPKWRSVLWAPSVTSGHVREEAPTARQAGVSPELGSRWLVGLHVGWMLCCRCHGWSQHLSCQDRAGGMLRLPLH